MSDTFRQCYAHYEREGGRQPNDRIVRCGKVLGHVEDHEEVDGGATWPRSVPDPAPARVAFEGITSATILKPGDKVLLMVSGNWTMERIEYAQKLLGQRFPDAEFTFVSQVDTMIVKPADD